MDKYNMDKLMAISNKLEKQGIDIDIVIERLSETEINIILNGKHPDTVLELLTNNYFSRLDNSIKNEIINVILNAKTAHLAEFLRTVAVVCVDSEYLMEFINIINESNRDIAAFYAASVAKNWNVEINGYAVELTRLVSKANSPKYASLVALDRNSMKSGKIVELVKIISEAKYLYQAQYASMVARDSNAIESGYVVDLVEIISEVENDYQAEYAAIVATNSDVLKSGYVLGLTEIVSKSKGAIQAKCASEIALNGGNDVLELTKIASEIEVEYHEVDNENIDGKKFHEKFIAGYIELEKIEQQGSEIYKQFELKKKELMETNFWLQFEQNSELTIKLLEKNMQSDEEITSSTKVKKYIK